MKGGEIKDEFITLLNKKHELPNEGGDESILVSKDVIFVREGQYLRGDDVAVFIDFLDVLGMGS
jgi:hypothetical protein